MSGLAGSIHACLRRGKAAPRAVSTSAHGRTAIAFRRSPYGQVGSAKSGHYPSSDWGAATVFRAAPQTPKPGTQPYLCYRTAPPAAPSPAPPAPLGVDPTSHRVQRTNATTSLWGQHSRSATRSAPGLRSTQRQRRRLTHPCAQVASLNRRHRQRNTPCSARDSTSLREGVTRQVRMGFRVVKTLSTTNASPR
jgi:hypothetical protein